MQAYQIKNNSPHLISALVARISAGEPIAVTSELEWIDLHAFLTGGSDSCLLLKVSGDSMIDVPIASGDWVILDRARRPQPNDIVLAQLNGGFTIKRHKLNDANGRRGLYLVPANVLHNTKAITESDDFEILGVVTLVLHSTI